jgi:hypothetical protein
MLEQTMPVIQNADLTSVSTKNEPFPEGNYDFVIFESELSDDQRTVIIKHKCEAGDDPQQVGREYWNWINLIQNDGKPNRVGAIQIKRYMEAVFGEGSPEAETASPDTDVLNGHRVKLFLKVRTYTPKGSTEEKKSNEVKMISAV